MHLGAILLLSALLATVSTSNGASRKSESGDETLANVYCAPHVHYIETDPESSQYYPLMVRLHRCEGSHGKASPKFIDCVPAKIETVQVPVHRVDDQTKERINIPLLNHTQCRKECKMTRSACNQHESWDADRCQCVCNYPNDFQLQPECSTKHTFITSAGRCGCRCLVQRGTCPVNKVWDHTTCGCICAKLCPSDSVIDQDTCFCKSGLTPAKNVGVSSSGISMNILIVALAVEAAIFTVVCIGIYICVSRRYRHRYERAAFERGNSSYSANVDNNHNVDMIEGEREISEIDGGDEKEDKEHEDSSESVAMHLLSDGDSEKQ